MPARRAPKQQPKTFLGSVPDVAEVPAGGIGLDFETVPGVLDDTARAEWMRLAGVYRPYPTRPTTRHPEVRDMAEDSV